MEQFFSINIGQIVQTLVIVFGGFIALGSMKAEIRHQGDRLRDLDEKVDKLEIAFIQLARQDERINAMDQRMLSQGRRLDRVEYHGKAKRREEQDQD